MYITHNKALVCWNVLAKRSILFLHVTGKVWVVLKTSLPFLTGH